MNRQPHLVVIGDPLADIVIPVRPEVCARLTVAPGTAEFVDRAVLDRVVTELGGGQVHAGGSAANTGVAFAASGGRASMLAGWMGDELTAMIRADLCARGVVLPQSTAPGGSVGRCLVLVLPDGERAFLIWQGEPWRTAVLRDGVRTLLADGFRCDGVLVEGYLLATDDGMRVALTALARCGMLGASRILSLSDRTLVERNRQRFRRILADGVDVVFGNEAEFAALSEVGDAELVTEDLVRRGVLCVVTLGGRGAMTCSPGGRHAVPSADQVSAPSAVGAGDALAGGFLFGLLSGFPHPASLRIGTERAGAVLRVSQARVPRSVGSQAVRP